MSRVSDMVQLCEQIRTGHHARKELVVNLVASGVAASATNQATRMANRVANEERGRSLRASLAAHMATLASSENGRRQDAERARKTRMKFLASLTRNCAAMARSCAARRKANKAENVAARAAWFSVAVSSKHGGKPSSLAV